MYKKSLKTIISLLLIFALLFSLTACGNSKVSDTMKDYAEGAYSAAEAYINSEIDKDEAKRKIESMSNNADKYMERMESEHGSTVGDDYDYFDDNMIQTALHSLDFAMFTDDYSKIKKAMKELKKYM